MKKDCFKLDVEAHIWPDNTELNYFPGMKWEHIAFTGVMRIWGTMKEWETKSKDGKIEFPTSNDPEVLIQRMDKYKVDMAIILPESGWGKTHVRIMSTNGFIMAARDKWPDRFIFCANVGPITARGIDYAMWEIEYLVKEKNCKMVKMYPCEDTYINDRQLWPFYKKVSDLGIPVCIHTGWCWVPPNLSKYCLTWQLDEVATEFTELKIIAYHDGWPDFRQMHMIAAVHPNVYISLSALLPFCITRPRLAAEIIGEAVAFAGEDRVMFGTDYCNSEMQVKYAVEGLANLEIPKDLQEGYGYEPLTDEAKAKIFGLNLAKLLGVEPRRRVK